MHPECPFASPISVVSLFPSLISPDPCLPGTRINGEKRFFFFCWRGPRPDSPFTSPTEDNAQKCAEPPLDFYSAHKVRDISSPGRMSNRWQGRWHSEARRAMALCRPVDNTLSPDYL